MADSEPRYKTHKNKEKKVKCPYCDTTTTSRGLYQHVWRTGDEAHNGHKNVPDTWEQDKNDLEVVGEQDVVLHVPTEKEYDQQRILCKHCGEDFQGTHGLSVHLSRISDSLHPDDAKVETSGLKVPVGPDDAVVLDDEMIENVEGHNLDPDEFSDSAVLEAAQEQVREGGESDSNETPSGHVPIPDLVELVGYYEKEGEMEAAEELRGLIQKYA